MTKVGFFCKYTWSDETYLTFCLAELANQLGLSTTWMCAADRDIPLHDVWDHRVRSIASGKSFMEWCSTLSHITWWEHQPNLLAAAIRQGIRNTLVVSNDRDFRNSDFVDYDHVVFPNSCLADVCGETPTSYVIPWQVSLTGHRQSMQSDGRRCYLPLGHRAADKYGPRLFYSLNLTLSNYPDLKLTISFARHWSRPALSALRDLTSSHPQRVTLRRKISYQEHVDCYFTHDLVIAAGYDDFLAVTPLEAMAANTAVVGVATPVYESVTDGYPAASLIPCKLRPSRQGADVRPDPSPQELVQGLSSAVQGLRPGPRLPAAQLTDFLNFWMSVWDV